MKGNAHANITITCLDNVPSRFEIAEMLKNRPSGENQLDRSIYWMDFGNSRNTGQVILSTVAEIAQPESTKFTPVSYLPFVTDEFKSLLLIEGKKRNEPSCSLHEALEKQDLFINPSLAQLGCSLLFRALKTGMTKYRGIFHDLASFKTTPIKVA